MKARGVAMKKVLPILIVVIAISLFGVYYMTKDDEDVKNTDSEFLTDDRLLELSQTPSELANFIFTVKDNPSQVIKTNSILWKMVYSGEYTKAERENLISMQRMLFSPYLLDENPKEFHFLTVEGEIEKWSEFDYKIIGSDFLSPEYHDVSLIDSKYEAKDLAIVKVVFYTNEKESEERETDLFKQYMLIKNQLDKWEIIGWADVDKFEIVK